MDRWRLVDDFGRLTGINNVK
jgi:hypothetical protein